MASVNRLRSPWVRAAIVIVVLALFGAFVSRLDLKPGLGHLDIAVISGAPEGNYHAIVDTLGARARKKHGKLANVTSEGSLENLTRLDGARKRCDVQFGLVQAGLPWPEEDGEPSLELIGRFWKAETMFLLGKDADKIGDFATLKGLKIAIGPEGSGAAKVAREIFGSRDFQSLGLVLSSHPVVEGLDLAQKGDVDLAVVVIDEDAGLVEQAVRDRGLQIAGLPHADVVARKFTYLRNGRIGAGQYDAVRMLPPVDKHVLRVETLLVGNRCASRSQTIGLLTLASDVFPDFIRHNKETPNATGLELSSVAKAFFENGGPEIVDAYLPRAGDVMPPSNWIHVAFGVSVLFNLMNLGNRFRLWRIDAARVKLESEIAGLFGAETTLGDIARMDPRGDELREAIADGTLRVIHELEALAERSRKQSLSVLVPMGQEMGYRYQEELIKKTISVLRAFKARYDAAKR